MHSVNIFYYDKDWEQMIEEGRMCINFWEKLVLVFWVLGSLKSTGQKNKTKPNPGTQPGDEGSEIQHGSGLAGEGFGRCGKWRLRDSRVWDRGVPGSGQLILKGTRAELGSQDKAEGESRLLWTFQERHSCKYDSGESQNHKRFRIGRTKRASSPAQG